MANEDAEAAVATRGGEPRAGDGHTNHTAATYGLLAAALWMIALVALGRAGWQSLDPIDPTTIAEGVDPNDAPWWDLSALPQVGEVTALRIVAYREAAARDDNPDRTAGPAFRHPIDMTRVKGIGPRTIQRLGPHLRLDSVDITAADPPPP